MSNPSLMLDHVFEVYVYESLSQDGSEADWLEEVMYEVEEKYLQGNDE